LNSFSILRYKHKQLGPIDGANLYLRKRRYAGATNYVYIHVYTMQNEEEAFEMKTKIYF
jgi:hypothetical protein